MPNVSVVIPTHNRAAMLREHLRAMSMQTYPRKDTEWIVVCDGCQDDSAIVARESGADRVIEQPPSGPAAARNAGLGVAQGRVVCFLDDDIIPTPGWVQAYVDDFEANPNPELFHMGYCPHAESGIKTYLDRRNADWYESKIDVVRQPGYEPRFTDFFCGNFAADRDALQAFGGFNPTYWMGEDFELAFRALKSGWRIRFVPSARADHHAHRDERAYGRQAFRAGQIEAVFVRMYPEVASHVRIGIRRRPWKHVAGVAWRAVALRTSGSLRLVESLARIGERLHFRPALDLLYPLLWDGNYWRGVAAAA
jgi:GT2 family glycosyltransferase